MSEQSQELDSAEVAEPKTDPVPEALFTIPGARSWVADRTNRYHYPLTKARRLVVVWTSIWFIFLIFVFIALYFKFSDKFTIMEATFLFSLDAIFPGIVKSLLRNALENEIKEEIVPDKLLNIAESSAHLILTVTIATVVAFWVTTLVLLTNAPASRRVLLVLLVICVICDVVCFCYLVLAPIKFMNVANYKSNRYIPWVFPDTVQAPMNFIRMVLGFLILLVLGFAHGLPGI